MRAWLANAVDAADDDLLAAGRRCKLEQLNMPTEFETQFGVGWQVALDAGDVYHAVDAYVELGLDARELDVEWDKAEEAGELVKFGGTCLYCGLIDIEGKEPIYVYKDAEDPTGCKGFFSAMLQRVADNNRLSIITIKTQKAFDTDKKILEETSGTNRLSPRCVSICPTLTHMPCFRRPCRSSSPHTSPDRETVGINRWHGSEHTVSSLYTPSVDARNADLTLCATTQSIH